MRCVALSDKKYNEGLTCLLARSHEWSTVTRQTGGNQWARGGHFNLRQADQ